MASHRLKRTLTAVAIVAVAAGMTSLPAGAAPGSPPPPATGTPLQQYHQLSQQASDLNNKLQAAQADLASKQAGLAKTNSDLAAARQAQTAALAQESKFRGQVDAMTDASFEGAQFNQFSALLTGTSTRDFLDRATALSDMATDNQTALDTLAAATKTAQSAEQRAQADAQKAQDATNAAAALVTSITQQAQALQVQVNQVKTAATKLSAPEKATVQDTGIQGNFVPPSGAAGAAMQVALGKRGSAYVYGAAGPNTFDCSGLVMYAFGKEGVSLPHSSQAQSRIGTLISNRASLQPGDLVFFGSGGNIHHVGIYVGSGDMVDAPDTGDVVKVQPLNSDYAWGRRL